MEPISGYYDWRRTREVAFGVDFWPLQWTRFGIEHDHDELGGVTSLCLGPVVLRLIYNIGMKAALELDRECGR